MSVAEVFLEPETDACFLCSPRPSWVYLESARFFAMLGLGPIQEGYSLIAARDHVPSMFDLSASARAELVAFTAEVRAALGGHYGSVVVTEHGRVAPCVSRMTRLHEPHCLHAHRLLFPGLPAIELSRYFADRIIRRAVSFEDLFGPDLPTGQYLYVESQDGSCEAVSVSGPFPRQFFRRVAAAQTGDVSLASWQDHPREDIVERARANLRAS